MSLPSRLLGANPSIQVSTLLSGSLTTPSAKGAFVSTAYESIASTTVGSGGSANVEFTSIPADYTHLQVRMIVRTNEANTQQNFSLQINSDTGNNYSWHRIYGSGSAAAADATSSTSFIMLDRTAGNNATASIFGAVVLDILDYKNTNKYKTTRMLGGVDLNASGGYMMFSSGLWQSTSAITSLKIFPSTGNWVQYSQFALYGIKGA